MKKDNPIANIMSRDVVTLTPADKPSAAKRLMADLMLHHIPIEENGQLVGVLSRVDLLQASFSNQLAGRSDVGDDWLDAHVCIGDIMTRQVISIKDYDTIAFVANLLSQHNFNALPVIDTDHKVVGIITSNDLIDYLIRQF